MIDDFDYGLTNNGLRITQGGNTVFLWFWAQRDDIREHLIALAMAEVKDWPRATPRPTAFCVKKRVRHRGTPRDEIRGTSLDELRAHQGLVRAALEYHDTVKKAVEWAEQHGYEIVGHSDIIERPAPPEAQPLTGSRLLPKMPLPPHKQQ